MAAILVGGTTIDATATNQTSVKTSSTKKASKPSGALAMVNIPFYADGKLYLMNNGIVKVTPASMEADGTYVKSDGAYIMNWGIGTYGDNKIGLIYGNTLYIVIPTDYGDTEFWSYYWNQDSNLAQAASFDANSQTVILNTDDGQKRIKLSSVSSDDQLPVTWF